MHLLSSELALRADEYSAISQHVTALKEWSNIFKGMHIEKKERRERMNERKNEIRNKRQTQRKKQKSNYRKTLTIGKNDRIKSTI